VVAVCDLLNVNVLHSGNLEIIVLVGFVTFVAWVSMGACFIYHGQNKMMVWYQYEKYANDEEELEKLRKTYQRIFDKQQGVGVLNKVKLDSIKDKMEYLIMRLSFINPMHLPPMTEVYLRKDFHFAMYLGYCYGKILTRFFKWSLHTVLILFGIVVLCNVFFTITADDMIDQLMRFIAFLTAFIILIMVKSCV
jgi:hypothetical protein